MRCKKASQRSDLVMPNLFVCGGGGGMNLLEGFWWGKFLVCGSRVANDVSAFAGPNRFGKEGIYHDNGVLEGDETATFSHGFGHLALLISDSQSC